MPGSLGSLGTPGSLRAHLGPLTRGDPGSHQVGEPGVSWVYRTLGSLMRGTSPDPNPQELVRLTPEPAERERLRAALDAMRVGPGGSLGGF